MYPEKKKRNRNIAWMWHEGYRVSKIAEKYNISTTRVHQILKRFVHK